LGNTAVFGVSQHFKTWVDLVVTDPRMAAGSDPIIAGRPAVLATVHGGAYAAGAPREGWDHATGWMRRILEDVWRLDLRVVESEFTLVGVNPALDEFKDLAAQMRTDAEELARGHGRSLSATRGLNRQVRSTEGERLNPDYCFPSCVNDHPDGWSVRLRACVVARSVVRH
jgi:hypothetical protein